MERKIYIYLKRLWKIKMKKKAQNSQLETVNLSISTGFKQCH